MDQPTYSYRYRPAFGGGSYMIEFMRGDEREELLGDVLTAISVLNPELNSSADMVFEAVLEIKTAEGYFTYSVDEWGGVFIEARHTILETIHDLLLKDPNFENVPIDPKDYD